MNGSKAAETSDPVELLFGGMLKLGPGSDRATELVLSLLPGRAWKRVVDAGCGAGRQTLVLARSLRTNIDAVDIHEPFLDLLRTQAEAAGLGALIQIHCMDMSDIPSRFSEIELLWSEGAAYNIGFSNALRLWRPSMRNCGYVVVSELSWLCQEPPAHARQFFAQAYPAMRSMSENSADASSAGYRVLSTCTLPPDDWESGYYEVLEERAQVLLDHDDEMVRSFAAETLQEIEVFRSSEGSFGYVFYVLRVHRSADCD